MLVVRVPVKEGGSWERQIGNACIKDGVELFGKCPGCSLSFGNTVLERCTFSDNLLEMSAVRARREPTKDILIKVMARVIHCWNRSRYKSASR